MKTFMAQSAAVPGASTGTAAASSSGGWFASISDNPMFTAGVGLVGMGTALAVGRQSLKYGFYLWKRHYLTTLEITSYDKSYWWMLQWMTKQAAQNTRHLSISTAYIQHDNGSVSTQFRFVPGPGRHFFRWNSIWFQVERQREKQSAAGMTGMPPETVTLTAFTRDQSILSDMLEDAKRLALAEEEGKTVVYTSWGQEWRPFGYPRRRRPLESVVLDRGVAEKIVGDVREFLRNGRWYLDRGIPYRRGYLLYGPPGSGKSSFIQALAGDLEYNVCVMNLSEKYLSDDRLNFLLSAVPQRSIILLEDVDAAFTTHRDKTSDANSLTFSGFLNALDGLVSSEGRIIFMTTNHLERLDPALLRPGRVDVKMFIDNASEYQIRKMFLRFYEDADEYANQFVERLRGHPVSTAQLQGHFVFHKSDPKAALDNINTLLEHPNVMHEGPWSHTPTN